MIDRILGLIESSGMSDSAICKELALGNGIIGKWRKGIQKPSTEAIIKVATYFHVSADYLLFGHENNTSFRFSLQTELIISGKFPTMFFWNRYPI